MLYTRPWKFNPLYGVQGAGSQQLWVQRDEDNQLFEQSLEPQNLNFGYTRTFTKADMWGKRLSFSVNVNSSMTFDLQRYTNSRLTFGLGLGTRIANFMDLSFSTTSENTTLYRYFQNLPFFDPIPVDLYSGVETGFFRDIVNSLRFGDEEMRKQSGFKLRSINVSLLHHLGDWNARLTIHSTPQLDQTSTPPAFKFQNEISFLVQWVPIAEIRTQIDYSRDKNLTVK